MILRRHSSSTASTIRSASRSLASVSRSRVKFVPTAAARPAISRAAAVPWSRRLRSTAARSPTGSDVPPGSAVPRAASMMYSGKPPVAACSSSARASGRGSGNRLSETRRPAASSGLRGISVSSPVARIRTIQPASSGSSSRSSWRNVAATRSRTSSARPRQNVMKASVLVAPLHVVQHQQKRTLDCDQRPGQAFQEAVTLPGIRRRSGAGPTATDRHEPGDFGAPGGIEGRHRRPDPRRFAASPPPGPAPAAPRPEALRRRDHRALQPCYLGNLGHQAGLPHTSATADQHETAAPRVGDPPRLLQHAELSGPADKLCRSQPGAAAAGLAAAGGRIAGRARAIRHWNAPRVEGSGATPSSRSSTDAQWW